MQIVIEKMRGIECTPLKYFVKTNQGELELTTLIGKKIEINFTGQIICKSCGIKTNKSYFQGFCYNCFITSPDAEECVLRPELCKAHLGISRDIIWANKNHLQPHYLYLAYTSELKIGVTRQDQIPTRWIDQGAAGAIPVLKTPNRHIAGVTENFLKKFYSDKTDWKKMLTEKFAMDYDLIGEKRKLHMLLPEELKRYYLQEDLLQKFLYPVREYVFLRNNVNLQTEVSISGVLVGIKGQYLMFQNGNVLNMRAHIGFVTEWNF